MRTRLQTILALDNQSAYVNPVWVLISLVCPSWVVLRPARVFRYLCDLLALVEMSAVTVVTDTVAVSWLDVVVG